MSVFTRVLDWLFLYLSSFIDSLRLFVCFLHIVLFVSQQILLLRIYCLIACLSCRVFLVTYFVTFVI